MRRGPGLLLVAVGIALAASAAASAQAGWKEREAKATRYAEDRAGVESFALVDERGKIHAYRGWKRAPSASLLKAMLLVAYLNRSSVKGRALTDADRGLLRPMIRWSDNATATQVLGIVGESGLNRVARRADMLHFRLRSPWGLSTTSARDQARFFWRIDRLVPARHRPYALRLLNRIVPAQRWGIPLVKPRRFTIYFKGGWGSGTGWVTHQSALLRRGERRISVSVLTRWNPSHDYGTRTIQGIAGRLLRQPLPQPPE
ncbi:MAG TPA: serine hydrolase [Gaiellaceae bacterium]|nr:serine hydrolase [Gaiellaceae bacterium]